MIAETWPEQRKRLKEMANAGTDTWDLSPRDCQAISAVLKRLAELEAENTKLKASRKVPELDNHHNALVCGYCSGPIKEENTALKNALREERDAEHMLGKPSLMARYLT